MRIDNSFQTSYREIEDQMRALAEADGDVFLPNAVPLKPVKYVFVCMEPSLGRWARSKDDARLKVEAGFQNFTSSVEDFILHFCIREYLCEPTHGYHLTDLSKGAMLVKHAEVQRTERYDRWYELLVKEIDLVAMPRVKIFTIGNEVAKHLERCAFSRPFTKLIHYSGLAGNARAESINGREKSFDKFRSSVSLQNILATAEDVLRASTLSPSHQDETLVRLKKSELSESRKKLIFSYKCVFEAVESSGQMNIVSTIG